MLRTKVLYAHVGRPGAGHYGESMGKQTVTLTDPVRARVTELVKTIPFTDNTMTFNIGDYGTADGAASMTFIRDIIVTLREHHGPDVQFQVIYEDQATNDFNSLFKRLSGIIPDPSSYLLELDNVYPLASGIDFRKQCVPSNSMHFIMSISAVHWLSRIPVSFNQGLSIYPRSNMEEKTALKKQGDEDLESFLLMRSNELKHGGLLLVCTSYMDDDGKDENYAFSFKTFICILTDIWVSFRKTGRITDEEFINTNLPVCMYSLKQLRAPFEDMSSVVSTSGLRLIHAERYILKCVFYSAWKEKKELTGTDDREEFARSYVAAHRNWSYSTFLNGLSDTRTLKEKEGLVEKLYEEAQNKIIETHPDSFVNDVIYSYLIVRKE